jgi:nicotinate-nucleotide pyrophosphorylase (carboxylating)
MIKEFVLATLAEDVGRGDLYALVEPSVDASAKIIAKSDGVVSGVKYIDVLAELEGFELTWLKSDSEKFVKGDVIATISGDSHTLLRIERTLALLLL